MRERPIIFSGPMVRAILAGQKTQTRRAVDMRRIDYIGPKGCANDPRSWGYADGGGSSWLTLDQSLPDYQPGTSHQAFRIPCPYGQPGDRLWVREAFYVVSHGPDDERFDNYAADGTEPANGRRVSPLFMLRHRSRITLDVIEVRVQRLHDISEEDARAEGARYHDGRGVGHSGWRHDDKDVHADARSSFARFWDATNGKRAPWASNPWVWCVTFKRVAT